MTTSNPVKTKRLPALDMFRGLTILAMLVVNEIPAVKGVPDFLRHVPANQDGMSFADLIFPAFLFITGLAIPASGKSEASLSGFFTLCKRSAALIIIGLFMVNAEAGFNAEAMLISPKLWAIFSLLACYLVWGALPACPPPYRLALQGIGALGLLGLALLYQDGHSKLSAMQTQWWGILGLIGWAYLLCASLYTLGRRHPVLLVLAQLAVLALLALSPETSFFYLNPHLSHSSIMLAGVLAYELLHGAWSTPPGSPAKLKTEQAQPYLRLAIVASLYFAAAQFSHGYFPYSKIAATPPWILASIAFCLASYALLQWSIQTIAWHQRLPLFLAATQNALLCYTLPYVIAPALQLAGWHYPWQGAEFFAGFIMALIFALSLICCAGYLQARGIRWRI